MDKEVVLYCIICQARQVSNKTTIYIENVYVITVRMEFLNIIYLSTS